MRYRPYTSADFDALYAIEKLCFKPPHRFSRRYVKLLVSRASAATWIAEEDAQLTGFAIVEWTRRKAEVTAYIQTIEVAPDRRRRGIARELLAQIENSARTAGAALIRLHVDAENYDAIRLYEANSYHCVGRHENYYPQNRAALLYQKHLNFASSGLDSVVKLPISVE